MIIMDTRHSHPHLHNVYRTVPFQWALSPVMNGPGAANPSLPPPPQPPPQHQHPPPPTHSSTAFYSDCREIVQLMGIEQIGIHHATPFDVIPLQQMHQKGSWGRRGRGNWKARARNVATSSGQNTNVAKESAQKQGPDEGTRRAGNKTVKRQDDLGNTASTSKNGVQEPQIVTKVLHAGVVSGTKRKNASTSPPRQTSGRDSPLSGPSLPKKRPLLSVSPSPPGSPPPKGLLMRNEWDKLSSDIYNKFRGMRQSPEIYDRKMRLHEVVCSILKPNFTIFGLYVVGSSMTGFGTNASDMDMCLMISHGEIEQRSEAMKILRYVLTAIKRTDFVQYAQLIPAKVPILQFTDSVSGVEVDLNVNNAVGIRNTHMLVCYARLDWRLRPLVMVIKLWAKAHDINDAKRRTLSSYSLVLMVIHYLQQISPPVLPCLHKLYPQKFNSTSDVRRLSLTEDLLPFNSENIQSLGELIVGFFFYYSHTFNFVKDAISVRLGEKLPRTEVQFNKTPKNDPFQWKCLCIEEPFDFSNTARAVFDNGTFENIKYKFFITWKKLTEYKELSCIFPPGQC